MYVLTAALRARRAELNVAHAVDVPHNPSMHIVFGVISQSTDDSTLLTVAACDRDRSRRGIPDSDPDRQRAASAFQRGAVRHPPHQRDSPHARQHHAGRGRGHCRRTCSELARVESTPPSTLAIASIGERGTMATMMTLSSAAIALATLREFNVGNRLHHRMPKTACDDRPNALACPMGE